MRKKIIFIAAFVCLINHVNAQSQWTQVTDPSAASASVLVTMGTNLFAGVSNKGVYFSPDGGTTWMQRNGAYPDIEVFSLATNGTDIFAGIGGHSGAGILKSSDLGITWVDVTPANMMRPMGSTLRALAIDGADIYICSDQPLDGLPGQGIYKSSIPGIDSTTWTSFNTGFPQFFTTSMIRTLKVKGTNIYAGMYGDGIWVSSTSSPGWSATSGMAAYNDYISDISFNGNIVFAGDMSATPAFYRSVDNGLNWTQSDISIFDNKPIYAVASDSTAVYAGTEGNGVLRSNDNGVTWTTFNEGFLDASGNWLCNNGVAARSLVLKGNLIFAATDCGVWKRTLAVTPITPVTVNDSLVRIYPNPATHTITLKVGRDDIGSTFIIKDATGNILLKKQLTSETTSVEISGLATGVYFIQVGHKRGVEFLKK